MSEKIPDISEYEKSENLEFAYQVVCDLVAIYTRALTKEKELESPREDKIIFLEKKRKQFLSEKDLFPNPVVVNKAVTKYADILKNINEKGVFYVE